MIKKEHVVPGKGVKQIREIGSKFLRKVSATGVATPRQEKRFVKEMADWIVKNGDEDILRTEMTNIIKGFDPRHLRDVFLGLIDLIHDVGDAAEIQRFTRRFAMYIDWIIKYGPIRRDEAAGLSKSANCLSQPAPERAAS